VATNADFEIRALVTRSIIATPIITFPAKYHHRPIRTRATMPKFFCDYCDVYLTHDSMSVRKAHNNGRNHLRNVQAYYEQISSDQTQQVINSITDAYNSEGQANPLYQANLSGGFPGGPMAGMPGMGPPMGMGMPMPMGMPPNGMPGFPPPGESHRASDGAIC
jgi:U1 small nuclear ribonucleoprotein C